jgi:hypothetical protein
LNRYAYARNNPLRYTDLSGHSQTCEDSCGTQGQRTMDDPECQPAPANLERNGLPRKRGRSQRSHNRCRMRVQC